MKEAYGYRQKMMARDQLWQSGSDLSRHPNDILVRHPREAAKPLAPEVKQAIGQEHSTLNTLDNHEQSILNNFHSYMKDVMHPEKAGAVGIRDEQGGRWVLSTRLVISEERLLRVENLQGRLML